MRIKTFKRRPFAKVLSSGFLVVAAVFIAIAIIPAGTAKASIFDDWYFNGDVSEGYFSNAGTWDWDYGHRSACGYGNGCPVLPNGDYSYEALNGAFRDGNNSTAQSVQRAKDLIAQLKSYNQSGNPWAQAGSGFIASSMLGYGSDNGNRSRSPSAAMWNEIEGRLVDRASKGRINWNVNFNSNGQDTYSRILYNTDGVWRWDVVYDGTYNTRNGIIIYNDNGTEAYKLWYLCGNPVGSMSGLPVASYNLTPNITGSPSNSEGGTPVTLTPTINNAGPATTPGNDWQITNFNLAPGVGIPNGGTNGTAPVSHYGNGATVIGSGTRNFSLGVTTIPIGAQTIGDLPVGSRVCYGLSIRPYNQATTNWRHSAPFCVTIAKKPKVQVTGSDLIVGKGLTSRITTSSTTKNVSGTNRTYGSWAEYGVVASGIVTGMASGAGYSGGAPSNLFCDASLLTFTNAGTSTCTPSTPKGNYQTNKSLPDISARLVPNVVLGASPTINVATSTTNIYSATGNVTLTSSGPISAGRWVLINAPSATVTITNNITYSNGPFGSIKDIPQVVIIADQIRIAPNVTQLDAWLVASGTTGNITTCTEVANATQLTANNCNQRLTVNGPVIARHLFLYRTAGAGVGALTGVPAEVFNLRPDAYLWATAFTADAGRLRTVSTRELPPRF